MFISIFITETQTEEPAAEDDHGPAQKPHLGDQLHAGCQELKHTHTHMRVQSYTVVHRLLVFPAFVSSVFSGTRKIDAGKSSEPQN